MADAGKERTGGRFVAGCVRRGDRTAAGELARRAVDAADPTLSPQHLKVALKMVGQRDDKS